MRSTARRRALGPLLAVGLALPLPAALFAQIPGGQGVDVDLQRADFLNITLQRVRAHLGDWLSAWRGEAEAPLELQFAPLATLVPPGGAPLLGHEQIAAFGAVALPATADANMTITDFDASEGIAYLHGAYTFMPLRAGSASSVGQHATVMQRDGGRWRVRAQLYRPDAGSAPYPPEWSAPGGGALPVSTDGGQASRHDALTTLAALRGAWAGGNAAAAAAHFTGDALLQLPDQERPARGPLVGAALGEAIERFGALHTAPIDFGQAERLSWSLARYYLEPRAGQRPRDGYLLIVLAGPSGRRQIRSLVFTTPLEHPAPAATSGADARHLAARADSLWAAFTRAAPGACALAVVQDGLLLERGHGRLAGVAATAATPFAAAAPARMFAAHAAALLVQRGDIGLDDDVRALVPELPELGRTITVRHLLDQTSGLRDHVSLLALAGRAPDAAALLDMLGRQRALNFEPGAERLPSRAEDALLALIVRRASGRPLGEFAARSIFEPLAMADTRFTGDDGVVTSARDLARWAAGLAQLDDGGEARWLRAVEPRADGGYGEPVAAVRTQDGESAAAVICSSPGADAAALARQLLEPLGPVAPRAGLTTLADAAPAGAAATSAMPSLPAPAIPISAYAGTYHSQELDVHWRVEPVAGTLVLYRRADDPQPLAPRGGDAFGFGAWVVRFERGTDGHVEHLFVSGAGVRDLRFTARPR